MASHTMAATLEETAAEYKYVINLDSSSQPIKATPFAQPELRRYLLYTTKQQSGEETLYQLRLGFFKTRDEAQTVYKIVEHNYLDVSIDDLNTHDLPWLNHWLGSPRPVTTEKIIPAENRNLPYKELMQLADDAMQNNNYAFAIGVYTRIIESPPNAWQQSAQENLGLAREKNNQLAHAMAEYRLYLKMYPSGDGAARIKMRLDQLVTQQLTAFFMPGGTQTPPTETRWLHTGQLYQFYYNDKTDVDNTGLTAEQSFVTTSFNYRARTVGPAAPMQADLAFTHVYDTENSDANKERLTSLYFDTTSDNRRFDWRAGRQKNKTTSLFGRYDGIDLGYLFNEDYKARFTYGYPVEFNDAVEDIADKDFYALGVELFPNQPI
jgi:tetratricopeptide (TPR) repeat protein